MADIDLLFGVARSGSDGGDSEKLIREQLQDIVSRINSDPFKIRFAIDRSTIDTIRKDIAGSIGEISQSGSVVNLSNIEKSLTSIDSQLTHVLIGIANQTVGLKQQLNDIFEAIPEGSDLSVKSFKLITDQVNKLELALDSLSGSVSGIYNNLFGGSEQQSQDTAALDAKRSYVNELVNIFAYYQKAVNAINSAPNGDKNVSALQTALYRLRSESASLDKQLNTFDLSHMRAEIASMDSAGLSRTEALMRSLIETLTQFGRIAAPDMTAVESAAERYRAASESVAKATTGATATGDKEPSQANVVGEMMNQLTSAQANITNILQTIRSLIETTFDLSTVQLNSEAIVSNMQNIANRIREIIPQDLINAIGNASSAFENMANASSSSSDRQYEQANKLLEIYDSLSIKLSDIERNGGASSPVYADIERAMNDAANLRNNVLAGMSAEEYSMQFSDLELAISRVNAAYTGFMSGNKGEVERLRDLRAISELLNRVEGDQRKWSALSGDKNTIGFIEDLRRMQNELISLRNEYNRAGSGGSDFSRKIEEIRLNLKNTEGAIKSSGRAYKTFGDQLREAGNTITRMFSLSSIVMRSIRYIRQMIKTVVELDDAMTQLKIVTDESAASYDSYAKNISEAAKRIGASTKDLIDATTTYARLGYSMSDSGKLAEYTAMLQNVGDIEADAAQDAITAIIKAYKNELNIDDIESVMDRLVIVGNNFPISVSQLAEGINNAGSSLAVAGNTFNQSLALLAAANTTVQNISKASTGLRTITARIRNTKTELDDLGEAMESSDYDALVSALTDANVSLVDSEGQYRSTYDILKDISDVWNDLTTNEQAALSETLSGTRQQNIFTSIVTNFQEATGAMEAMDDSAGALDESYSEYMDSITAHVNTLKSAFAEFSQTLFDSGLITFVVDAGTALTGLLDSIFSIADAIGGLGSILSAILGYKIGKRLELFITNLIGTNSAIAATGASAGAAGAAVSVASTEISTAGTAIAMTGVEAEAAGANLTMLGLDAAEAGAYIVTTGTEATAAGTDLAMMGSEAAVAGADLVAIGADAATTSTELVTTGTSATTAGNGMVALGVGAQGASVGLKALLGWLGLIVAAIGFITAGIIKADTEGKQAAKEARKEIKNASDDAVDATKNISDAVLGFASVRDEFEKGTKSADEYNSAVDNLSKTLQDLSAGKSVSTYKSIKESADAAEEAAKRYKDLQTQIDGYAILFNSYVNGNVDYSKRPLVSPEDMRKAGWDFDGDIATTFSIGEIIGAEGAEFSIEITPILENGEVLSEEELKKYIQSLFTGGSIADLLASDINNLIIDARSGIVPDDQWDVVFNIDKLGDIKNAHWELTQQLREEAGAIQSLKDESIDESISEIQKQRYSILAEYSKVSEEIDSYTQTLGKGLITYDLNAWQANIDAAKRSLENFFNWVESANGQYIPLVQDRLFGDYGEQFYEKYGWQEYQAFDFVKSSLSEFGASLQTGFSEAFKEITFRGLDFNLENIVPEDMSSIDGLREAYSRIGSVIDGLNESGLYSTEIFSSLSRLYTEIGEKISGYETILKDLNKSVLDEAVLESIRGKSLPKTQEEFDAVRDDIISGLRETGNELYGLSSDEVPSFVDSLLASYPIFAQFAKKADASANSAESSFEQAVDKIKEDMSKLPDQIESFTKQMGIVKDAAKEMQDNASTGGGLSLDTIQKILDANSDYIDFLYVENGAIKLNTKSMLEYQKVSLENDISGIIAEINAIRTRNNATMDSVSLELQRLEAKKAELRFLYANEVAANGKYSPAAQEIYSNILSIEKSMSALFSTYEEARNEFLAQDDIKELEKQKSLLEKLLNLKDQEIKNLLDDIDNGTVGNKKKSAFEQSLDDMKHRLAMEEITQAEYLAWLDENYKKAYKKGTDEYNKYMEEVYKGRKEIEKDAADAFDDLIDFYKDKYKEDIDNQKDALDKKLDALKDFYDKQKKMLKDEYDEEKYLEEQAEKRKSVTDIQSQIAQLSNDNSAWAQKRLLELQQELIDAQKELTDFEKDRSLELATDMLDSEYEKQAAAIQAEMDALDSTLNNPETLFNKALKDVQDNSSKIYTQMLEYNRSNGDGNNDTAIDKYNTIRLALEAYKAVFGESAYNDKFHGVTLKGYASGTPYATAGLHRINENGFEHIFESSNGKQYKLFYGGEKVLDADSTNFLYNFAVHGKKLLSDIWGSITSGSGVPNIAGSSGPVIQMGDININGSATSQTVSEIRRAQREGVDYILKEFIKLKA